MQMIIFTEEHRQLHILQKFVSEINKKLVEKYDTYIINSIFQTYKKQSFSLGERPDLFEDPLIIFYGDLYDEIQIGKKIGKVLVFTEDPKRFNTLDAVVVKSLADEKVKHNIEAFIEEAFNEKRTKMEIQKI